MSEGFARIPVVLFAAFGMLFAADTQDVAAQGTGTHGCSVRDKSAAVAIVLCPPGLGQEQWRQVAETACVNTRSCSAWIWDDPKKVPAKAPPLPTGIAKTDILNSVAVWDNDKKQLLTIQKTN